MKKWVKSGKITITFAGSSSFRDGHSCIMEIKIKAWSRSFVNLQINLIFCGKRTANQTQGNFALNQWENNEIADIKTQKIKQILCNILECQLWISRSSNRDYRYPTQKFLAQIRHFFLNYENLKFLPVFLYYRIWNIHSRAHS